MQKNNQAQPELTTEAEFVVFLRIAEVSNSKDYHNVIENLSHAHRLSRIHIRGKLLRPRETIREWIKETTRCVEQSLAPQAVAGYTSIFDLGTVKDYDLGDELAGPAHGSVR